MARSIFRPKHIGATLTLICCTLKRRGWKAGKRFGDCSLELRTGKHDKLEGVFKGNGETFGEWGAFLSFKAELNASNGVQDLDERFRDLCADRGVAPWT